MKIERKRANERIITKFRRRERELLFGWGVLFFGLAGGLYYFAYYPKEKLFHVSFVPAVVQNSLLLDGIKRRTVRFRVLTESGDDFTIAARYPASLGIDAGRTCVELRKGEDSGEIYPRLVPLQKCNEE